MPNFKSISFKMAVLQRGRAESAPPHVCAIQKTPCGIGLNLAQIHFPGLSLPKLFLTILSRKYQFLSSIGENLSLGINRRKGSSKFQRDHGQHRVKFKVLYWLRLLQLQPEYLHTIN